MDLVIVPLGDHAAGEAQTRPGENALDFNCATPGASARAYVTVIGKGEPL